MNHHYASQSQGAHTLSHELHGLSSASSGYPPQPAVSQLPSMTAPSPTSYNSDPYSQHHQHSQQHQQPPHAASHHQQPPLPPPSMAAEPLSATSPVQEPKSAAEIEQSRKNLLPFSYNDGRWKYSLDVVQQPQRARMCGFGDKDRRPITPPPCVRLIITDLQSGKEVDCNEIEHSMYVLNVDLWSDDACKEVNLVRHTTATPSISSTTPASYATLEQSTPAYAHILPSSRSDYPSQVPQPFQQPNVNAYAQQGYNNSYMGGGPSAYSPANQYFPNNEYQHQVSQMPSQSPTMSYGPPRVFDMGMAHRLSLTANQPQGMFTRNLIGSLAASAFRLTDPSDRIGIWFILQDLSVRTEGLFRLRFSFVNVGMSPPISSTQQPQSSSVSGVVNTGRAPVLASCYSEVFQVYSAKKFPGVCESTGLSKCFATQGIKIPIRKEGSNAKGGDDDDDD